MSDKTREVARDTVIEAIIQSLDHLQVVITELARIATNQEARLIALENPAHLSANLFPARPGRH